MPEIFAPAPVFWQNDRSTNRLEVYFMPLKIVATLLAAVALLFPPAELPPVVTDFGPKLENYYRKPDPRIAGQFFAELLKPENIDHKWFDGHADVLDTMGTQLGDLAKEQEETVRLYEAGFPKATIKGKRVILAALKICGDETSQAVVAQWLKKVAPDEMKEDLEALHKHLADPDRKHFRELPARTPHEIDLLWGNFYITGEYEPISTILDVFDRPDDKDTPVLRRVAKFSLGSNLQRHPKLVELVQKHRKERGAGSEKALSEPDSGIQEVTNSERTCSRNGGSLHRVLLKKIPDQIIGRDVKG